MNKIIDSNTYPDACSECQIDKSHRLPLTHVYNKTLTTFEII